MFVRVGRYGHAHPGKRLTDQVVRTVVKERGLAAGLDVEQLSGHTLCGLGLLRRRLSMAPICEISPSKPATVRECPERLYPRCGFVVQ